MVKFGQKPCTIVQGFWPDFGATLTICKNAILIGFMDCVCVCVTLFVSVSRFCLIALASFPLHVYY